MEYKYFVHSGVKGMRWGVRRFQNHDGTLTSLGRKRYKKTSSKKSDKYHEDYKKAHNKKSIKEMSDQELRERNNRLNSEKQYKELTKKKGIGKKAVSAFIAGGATLTALTVAVGQYKKVADKAIDKVGDHVMRSIDLSGKIA